MKRSVVLQVSPPIDRPEPTTIRWGTIVPRRGLEELLEAGQMLALNLESVDESHSPMGEYVVTFSIVVPGITHPRDGEI